MYEDRDEEREMKAAFAAAFLRDPTNPMRAALSVEPRTVYANFIVAHWQYDGEVQELMRELRTNKGVAASIPTKEEFAAAIYREAEGVIHKDTKLDYYKLFASVMGFIEKPSTPAVVNTNIIDNRRVMIAPAAPASVDDWEAQATAQQTRLINAAS